MLCVECLRFGSGLPLSGSANSSTNRTNANGKPSTTTQLIIQSGEECFGWNAYALAVGYPCPGLQIAGPRAAGRCKSIKRSFRLQALGLRLGYPCPGLQIARPRAGRIYKSIKNSSRLQTFGLCLGYPCPGPQIAWPKAGRRCKASKKVLGYKLGVYAWATLVRVCK